MVGQRFGKWTVLSRAASRMYQKGTAQAAWNCQCDCGNKRVVSGINLRSGRTKSCGRCSKLGKGESMDYEPRGPLKGEVAERAIHWLNGKNGGTTKVKREAAMIASEFRETMLRYCKDKKYPPCMKCNDVTVAYCAETETECQNFLLYASGCGGNKKNQEG